MEENKSTDLAKKALQLGILFMAFHVAFSFFRANLTLGITSLLGFVMKDLEIGIGQAGYLYQLPSTIMGIGMLFGSIIIDKWGTYKTFVIGIVVTALSGIVTFFAKGSFTLLIISRIVLGASSAITYPVVMTIVAERFHNQKQRAMASAVVQSTNCFTNVMTQRISVPLFMALGNNYNNLFGIWGLGCVVCLVIFGVFDRSSDAFFKDFNKQFTAESKAIAAEANEVPGSSILKAIKIRKVWSAVIGFTGMTWLYTMYMTYLPTILKTAHGMSPAEASNTTSIINTVGIIVCLLTGYMIKKTKDFKPLMVLFTTTLTVGGILAMVVKPGFGMTLSMVLIGIGWFCYIPVVNTAVMMTEGVTPKIFAAATAVWTVLGCVLSLLIPSLFATLSASMGMQKAVIILSLGGLIAIGGSLYWPNYKKDK